MLVLYGGNGLYCEVEKRRNAQGATKQMKVLMLGWELPPNYVGGMGIVCDQLTRQLARDGVDIEFILPFYADYSHIKHMKVRAALDQDALTLMQSGGTYDSMYYTVVKEKDGKRVIRTLHEQVHAFADNVGRLVELGSYDVIHVHDWLTLRAGIVAKQKTGLPLFVHIHATEFDRSGGGYGNPVVREMEYIGLHMADHIFALSSQQKRIIMEQYGIPEDKITITENYMEVPVNLRVETHETFPYIMKMKEIGYKVITNAGRITIQKGLVQLLEAARKVVDHSPKTLFLICGGGEQIEELQVKAAELGIGGNVLFTGRVDGTGKQWSDAFRVADLFVMPSVSEPMGLTPYEAIAYGAPTLISKQSGIAEVLKNSLKVDYWDIDEMANKICGVLDNPELHDTLLASAQHEHNQKSWAPIAARIRSRYSDVLNRYGRRELVA